MTKKTNEKIDYAAQLALFLLNETGSVCGKWHGRMNAVEQRALYGRFIGRGLIIIDGTAETIHQRVKVCFGTDWDDRNYVNWKDL
jgi:hypothetical protein